MCLLVYVSFGCVLRRCDILSSEEVDQKASVKCPLLFDKRRCAMIIEAISLYEPCNVIDCLDFSIVIFPF